MTTYRTAAAAAALDLTVATLRRSAEEAGLELERRQIGISSARVFRPDDLFTIARWRAERYGPTPSNPKIVTVWGPKGGIGKTTMSANLGVAFALQGLRVLMIDLDFQASLTLSLGYDSDLTVEEAAEQGLSPERVVHYHVGHLLPGSDNRRTLSDVVKKPWGEAGPHLIPADVMLDHIEYELLVSTISGKQSDLVFAKLIREGRSGSNPGLDLSQYDLVLFDCPPSKNRLTRAALLASEYVISPVNFECYSTKAISYLAQVFTDMAENYNKCPELIILGNAHDAQRVRSSMHIATIAAHYGEALLEQTVRRSEDFPKALDEEPRAPVMLSRPTSAAAADVREAARLLANRMNLFDRKFSKQETQDA